MSKKIEAAHSVGDHVNYSLPGDVSGRGVVKEVKFNYSHNGFVYYVELAEDHRLPFARFFYDAAASLCRVAWDGKRATVRAFFGEGLAAV